MSPTFADVVPPSDVTHGQATAVLKHDKGFRAITLSKDPQQALIRRRRFRSESADCRRKSWVNEDEYFYGTGAICISGTVSVAPHVWGGEACIASDPDGATGLTVSTIDGKSGNVGAGVSLTFQGSNARTLKSMCGKFTYVSGNAGEGGEISGSGFNGGGVQGGNYGLTAGVGVMPYMVEGGTSNTRLVWVPGDGGNQCSGS